MAATPVNPSSRGPSWRERLERIIFETDTPAGKTFDVALILTICASVTVVVLSTLPFAGKDPYRSAFLALEWSFTSIFTGEYVLRLIVARRRLRYAVSFYGIIDLLSILPAFIGLFVSGGERLLVVRTLRLLRVFRVFKLARYLSEATVLREALVAARHKIAVFITTVLIVVLIASAFMHIVEGNAGNKDFESMPGAMYWAIITMTTVGYGDITPVTVVGKVITAALVLMGYSLIVVPTGILSAEMAGVGRRRATKSCPSCGSTGHDLDAAYCKGCGSRLDVARNA
jgi:voltage-gated potassium channel